MGNQRPDERQCLNREEILDQARVLMVEIAKWNVHAVEPQANTKLSCDAVAIKALMQATLWLLEAGDGVREHAFGEMHNARIALMRAHRLCQPHGVRTTS